MSGDKTTKILKDVTIALATKIDILEIQYPISMCQLK